MPTNNASAARRLRDHLVEPRETLETEIKSWLDIGTDPEDRARLAKAIIALANHGGGLVIIGFAENAGRFQPDTNRPPDLSAYSSDSVNSIVHAYAEPIFHCECVIETSSQDGLEYPLVLVPGGLTAPVRSRRAGPNNQIVSNNTYYTRRPGPSSEAPQNGREWDALIGRCIRNGRDELLDQIRTIISGNVADRVVSSRVDVLRDWKADSENRWAEVVEDFPPDHFVRFPNGHFSFSYQLVGDFEAPSLNQLHNLLRRGEVRYTGWPPFWVPTTGGIEPYVHNDAIECWLGRDDRSDDAAHSDFWRVSPRGQFYLVRGYQEDSSEDRQPIVRRTFSIVLPTWRVGEVLLHAASMAREFGAPEAEIDLLVEWTGLENRQLANLGAPNRLLFDGRISRQDNFQSSLTVSAGSVDELLPDLVKQIVQPLYELFDFFDLPDRLVSEELTLLRRGLH